MDMCPFYINSYQYLLAHMTGVSHIWVLHKSLKIKTKSYHLSLSLESILFVRLLLKHIKIKPTINPYDHNSYTTIKITNQVQTKLQNQQNSNKQHELKLNYDVLYWKQMTPSQHECGTNYKWHYIPGVMLIA